ncbi:hypothetical protein NDU88_005366 [Pleurodeles waltl]|uniref:Uncharacterized protein n=1 Tax=Pleurodeles waltl TaxID=8319 RepID=A0AAV7MJ70_PLEWA|nr:hypothetical protein NDU88_005366 [Pleurodeles waltl]
MELGFSRVRETLATPLRGAPRPFRGSHTREPGVTNRRGPQTSGRALRPRRASRAPWLRRSSSAGAACGGAARCLSGREGGLLAAGSHCAADGSGRRAARSL